MIDRSTDVRGALRQRQRGFIIDPFRFGVPPPVDPLWSSVLLYIPGQGVDGGTTFPDVGPNAFTFAGAGEAQTSTATPIFGTSSILFDGSGDNLQRANIAAARFQAVDFTVEAHFKPSALQNACLIQQRSTSTGNGWETGLVNDGSFFIQATSGTPANVVAPTSSYAAGATVHLAFTGVYTGAAHTMRVFHEGTLLATQTTPVIANETGVLFTIGMRSNGTSFFTGNAAHIRVTLAARYTASFTPDIPPYPTS